MNRDDRVVAEGLQYQGVDEQIAYSLTTTTWGSTPSTITVEAYDESADYADVSSTVLSGTASVDGDVITLPTLKSLTDGHKYRVEIKFTVGGNVLEAVVPVQAQR